MGQVQKLETAFKTTDGLIFDCTYKAQVHQDKLNLVVAVTAWCEKHFCYSQNFRDGISEAIIEDREGLLNALGGDTS